MNLYIADTGTVTLDRLREISPQRAQRAQRYTMTDDKKRCIAGGLFIKRFLGDAKIYENEFGKPLADNGIFFNISHSGNYVIFAMSDCEVGCDIQQIDYIKSESAAKIVFCKNEMQMLSDAADKLGMFYRLWTKKESLLKCIGKGFHRNSKSVDVSNNIFCENGKEYYMRTYEFSDYVISVCSLKNKFPDCIEFVNL